MKKEDILVRLQRGEDNFTEFKEARNEISLRSYDTLCAFLNTQGGMILFGVDDKGNILGVDPEYVDKMKKNFADTVNNRFQPPIFLELESYEISGKIILLAQVPKQSQVYRSNGKTFVRNHSSSIDISNNNIELQKLYLSKSDFFSERQIRPNISEMNIRDDLIDQSRKLAINNKSDHSWKDMSNQDILRSIPFYVDDGAGRKGYTLASALVFGNDTVISYVVPAFKVDLIKRVNNPDRYDDRIVLRTNLLDCYERSMEFVKKYLPDPFFLEDSQRKSLRDIIFRELIVNMLIHKEYMFNEPTRLIIERNRIIVENSNNPISNGIVNLETSQPYPKNPSLCKFFSEIGLAEELGSGFRALHKYCREYTGHDPIIKDEHIFSVEIPINFFDNVSSDLGVTTPAPPKYHPSTTQVPPKYHPSTTQPQNMLEKINALISFCSEPKTKKEIMLHLKLVNSRYFRKAYLSPLIKAGRLKMTIPDKPNSPNQKYVAVTN